MTHGRSEFCAEPISSHADNATNCTTRTRRMNFLYPPSPLKTRSKKKKSTSDSSLLSENVDWLFTAGGCERPQLDSDCQVASSAAECSAIRAVRDTGTAFNCENSPFDVLLSSLPSNRGSLLKVEGSSRVFQVRQNFAFCVLPSTPQQEQQAVRSASNEALIP